MPLGKGLEEGIGVIRHVANQRLRIGVFQQRLCAGEIIGLSRREDKFDGVAESIDEGVNFGAQSAPGATNRLRAVFFLAPALCW